MRLPRDVECDESAKTMNVPQRVTLQGNQLNPLVNGALALIMMR